MTRERAVACALVSIAGLTALLLCIVGWNGESTARRSARAADPPDLAPRGSASPSSRAAASGVEDESHPLQATRLLPATDIHVEPEDSIRAFAVDGSDGTPIEGAEVFFHAGDRWEALGTTGALGVVEGRIRLPESGRTRFVGTHDAYARGETWVRCDDLNEDDLQVTVRLRPSSAIEGRVELPDGSSAGGGLTVLAMEIGVGEPGIDDLRNTEEGFPAALLTRTRADGSFRIHGLRAGEAYQLSVGGDGMFLMRRPRRSITFPAGATGVVLTVGYLLGAIVKLEDANGNDLPVPRDLWATRPTSWVFESPTTILSLDGFAGYQVRRDLDLEALGSGRFETAFYVLSKPDPPVRNPRLVVRLPGHERVDVDVPLAAPENLQIQSVRVPSTGTGETGSLELRFLGGRPPRTTPSIAAGMGRLTFVSLDDGERFFYGLRTTNATRIPGLIAGEYMVGLETTHGHFRWSAAEPVRIRSRGAESLEIDTSRLATVHIEPPHGNLLLRMRVEIRSCETGHASQLTFRRGPYVIECLPPGEYTMLSSFPRWDPAAPVPRYEAAGEWNLEVRSGERKDVAH